MRNATFPVPFSVHGGAISVAAGIAFLVAMSAAGRKHEPQL